MSAQAPSPPASARPLVWLFVVMLGLTLWITTRGWQNSILDRHAFRQLQTAESAYWIRETGYKLDYETPVFGPPWSIPMEFPVYQWIVASTSRGLGTSLEGTARGVSLFFFLATLPAVYLLAGFFSLAPSRRLLVVSAVLASPTYLFYGRTFMIETTALCFAVWFLYALGRAVRDNCLRCAVGATVFATLAALAKTTTFIVFLVPGAVFFLWLWLPRWRRPDEPGARVWLRAVLAALPVLVSVTLALWWVKHADRVKDSNPFAGFLTSRELVKWNWGTLEQRLSGEFWSANWSNISSFVLGEVQLAVLLLCAALVDAPFRRVAAWCAAFFLGGVLLFSNLFYHHDYYYCANALLLLFGAGVLLAGMWDNLRLPLVARMLALGLFFGGQLLLYSRGYAEHLRHPPAPPPGIGPVIQASVPADGVVLIYGWDWSSQMPYYAQRRAITVPEGREDEFKVLDMILEKLPPRRIAAMLVRHDPRRIDRLGFVRERTNRFQLSPAPFATSAEGELYLPEEAIPAATAKLQGRTFSDVTLHARPPSDPNEGKLLVNDLGALDFPMAVPKPSGARSMFGISVGEAGVGHKVILAHPDSELSFVPPAGATRITAEVGIAAGAYAPDATAVTDGVSVEIFELRANGLRRVLYRRELNPVKEQGDRGPQPIALDAAGPFNGTIVFKITPGPQNILVNDWAYWGRIEIR